MAVRAVSYSACVSDCLPSPDKLWTRHENAVTCAQAVAPGVVSTSSLDGRVVTWSLTGLDVSLATLGL